jgi:hypothetical protein
VVAVLDKLTDPDIPAVNKTDIVTPGFNPDEAGTIDDHLNRMRGPSLPPAVSQPGIRWLFWVPGRTLYEIFSAA